MTFEALGLVDDLLDTLNREGFEQPTPIQAKTIPAVIAGKDVLAQSATGSGKTLAFGLGMIQNIEPKGGIQSLVLTPTRELADQIYAVIKGMSRYKKLRVACVYGGVSINPQINQLKSADIVIATPGRTLDHMERGTIDLSCLKFFVLDEADRMLDMGFIDDIRKIGKRCPPKKQTLLFSATMPGEIQHLSKQFLHDPVHVKVGSQVDPSKLPQIYYDVKNPLKLSLLVQLLKEDKDAGLVMVFCNSRAYTEIVAATLEKNGVGAMPIHGGLTQQKRSKVIERFGNKSTFVLCCTDVAARGLDIPGVSHVYNYDIPQDSKQYVHRIGRTARAGKSGQVINLISDRDHDNFSRVFRDHDFKITKEKTPYVERVEQVTPRRESRDSRGFGGNRGGPRTGSRSGPRSGPRRDGPRGNTPRQDGPRRGGSGFSKGGPRRGNVSRGGSRSSSSSGPRKDGPKRYSGGNRR